MNKQLWYATYVSTYTIQYSKRRIWSNCDKISIIGIIQIGSRVSHSFWKLHRTLAARRFGCPTAYIKRRTENNFCCTTGQPGVNFWLPDRSKWMPRATGYVKPKFLSYHAHNHVLTNFSVHHMNICQSLNTICFNLSCKKREWLWFRL